VQVINTCKFRRSRHVGQARCYTTPTHQSRARQHSRPHSRHTLTAAKRAQARTATLCWAQVNRHQAVDNECTVSTPACSQAAPAHMPAPKRGAKHHCSRMNLLQQGVFRCSLPDNGVVKPRCDGPCRASSCTDMTARPPTTSQKCGAHIRAWRSDNLCACTLRRAGQRHQMPPAGIPTVHACTIGAQAAPARTVRQA
jgi:hypothetical protein